MTNERELLLEFCRWANDNADVYLGDSDELALSGEHVSAFLENRQPSLYHIPQRTLNAIERAKQLPDAERENLCRFFTAELERAQDECGRRFASYAQAVFEGLSDKAVP